MSIFAELRRRNVFRVAIAYLVTAWLVAQVAQLAFESFGTPDWVMKTLIFLLAIGLPFAVIFAWAFELTPEGIKREKDVDRSQSITPQTGRKLNYTIIGVLAAALAISIASHRWTPAGPDAPEAPATTSQSRKSIAVLPFVNMSDDPGNEYFSDGISEELLNVLVKVEGLRVASRTSSFSFKGKNTPIPEIAEALDVEHVLEGSVRKAGNTVRVTAQLIDVKTDSHLWSETYDRKLEDIFVIQDEISAHIVDELKVALGAGEVVQTHSRPTESLEAYENYLRGRHFWQRRGEDNIRKAIELFGLATETDPAFARAWSSLAAAHITLPTYAENPDRSNFDLARGYAEKALSLDASIAEAHAVLGDVARLDTNWAEAVSHYRQAIDFEPANPTGYLWYAEHQASVGHSQGALASALKSLELDPFNAGTNSVVSYAYAANGDLDTAITYAQAATDLGHPWAIYDVIGMTLQSGDVGAAIELVETRLNPASEERKGFEKRLAAAEDPGKIDAYLDWARVYFADQPERLAWELAWLGRIDEAASLFTRIELRGPDWMYLWLPAVQRFRQHPVFPVLLQRYGLVDYWDEFGWPETCSRAGDEITCR
jgi:TolB-like protein